MISERPVRLSQHHARLFQHRYYVSERDSATSKLGNIVCAAHTVQSVYSVEPSLPRGGRTLKPGAEAGGPSRV